MNQALIVLDRIRPYEDITKDLEKTMAYAEKASQLATLSEFTKGIAHEVRNPLGMMLSSAEIIAKTLRRLEDI